MCIQVACMLSAKVSMHFLFSTRWMREGVNEWVHYDIRISSIRIYHMYLLWSEGSVWCLLLIWVEKRLLCEASWTTLDIYNVIFIQKHQVAFILSLDLFWLWHKQRLSNRDGNAGEWQRCKKSFSYAHILWKHKWTYTEKKI